MMGRKFDRRSARAWLRVLFWSGIAWVVAGTAVAAQTSGEEVYKAVCVGCHQIGVLGAPKFRNAADWKPRLEKGLDTLVEHALNGVGKMPPKGGNPSLEPADLRAAIEYMSGTGATAKATKKAPAPAATAVSATAWDQRGADVVNRVCKGCHEVGVLGAPKIGNLKDWKPRLDKGEDTLVQQALKGVGNMPPKGGSPDLTADDLRMAIRYMSDPKAAERQAKAAAKAPKAQTEAEATAMNAALQSQNNVNRFNRLLRPKSERNRPPSKDGIHDPANEGTSVLQPPKQAFSSLSPGHAGNYVDWVKALEEEKIQPRWDLNDPTKEPLVMDLNIVREVKGSMPNVVYPHKQHLQWLDCSNCHPSIFEPRKGANSISMAEILLGRKCGVCHGKVAFPVSECRRCHSQKKAQVAQDKPSSASAAAKR